jgi:hypothetical protein
MVKGGFVRLPLDKRNKKEGPKRSTFLITLNTNTRIDGDSAVADTFAEALNDMTEAVMGSESVLKRFVYFIKRPQGGGFQPERDESMSWIRDVEDFRVIAKPEIGYNAKGKRLHLHVIVKMTHNGYVRLDKKAIDSAANDWIAQYNEGKEYKDRLPTIKYSHIKASNLSAEDYVGFGDI